MKEKLEALTAKAQAKIAEANSLEALEEIRLAYLGKKGELTVVLKGMGALSAEERPAIGAAANVARGALERAIAKKRATLEDEALAERLAAERLDITAPGKIKKIGHKHPLTYVLDDAKRIFTGMGYIIAEGPDIETYEYNFDCLNIGKDHPARDEQDTFYIEGGYVLRTATSPVQVRYMRAFGRGGKLPPLRLICPGSVYRADEVDATHAPAFHQLEGLVVDCGVTFGDLKGALTVFAKALLGENTQTRFRPHYFPFTEPSAEMDVSCFACCGEGCRVCKGEGWIELLGCGMVHPNVLKEGGIDPDKYTGFAFGMGIERLAMARYGITDMRLLFENDVNFLSQFIF